MDANDYMNQALYLAEKGRGRTSPNPMVGAVVVKNGEVVGRGYHEAAGEPHAEVNALNQAGEQARGADLYVTLEPCNHHGRTPPCTHRIIEAGVNRVVAAMADPNPDVKGGGCAYLRDQGVEVIEGVGAERARRINEVFIKYILTGRPFVTLKCAATLDGRIAARTGDAKWITGERSREYVHQLRHAVDAIMVGVGTVRADNPCLTARLEHIKTKDPARLILDTHLSIDPDARVLTLPSEAPTIVVAGEPVVASAQKKRIQQQGAQVITTPLDKGRTDLEALMKQLGAMEITSVLIEGGGGVIASALSAEIVDKICFFYAPKLLGGDDGVPICRGRGPERIQDCIRVTDITTRRFGNDIMIQGYIQT